MSYQELIVMDSEKASLMDSAPNGAVWAHATHVQGLRYANDGKTILIATSLKTITPNTNEASWSTAQKESGSYSVLLDKPAAATDGSTHLQFTPVPGLTLNDLQEAMTDGSPEWSFNHYCQALNANFVQFEFRFEDPGSDGWLEVTAVPLQGYLGTAAWVPEPLDDTTLCGFGGNTPDGSSVFEWGPLTAMGGLLVAVNAAWDTAETGEVATNYLLERIRLELWEAAPQRTAYVDTIIIDGVAYAVEPGMAGAQLSKPVPIVTLTFVTYRDSYGRIETLAPTVGAEQSTIVGPLLPVLFNDSDSYIKFEPSLADIEVAYRIIRVSNPS